jgi:ABC-type transport system involved in multi-copper enzyme maturation permease subunit
VGLYVAGVFAQDLRTVQAVNLTPTTMKSIRGLSYLIPNFENFNVMGTVAHGGAVSGSLVWQCTAYAVLYAAIVLVIAAEVFSRRNLK